MTASSDWSPDVHPDTRPFYPAGLSWDRVVVRNSRTEFNESDRRLRSALNAFFARRLSDPVEAEDMTQEVFCRLAVPGRQEVAASDSYVFAIAANLLRDRARREKVRRNYREARRLDEFLGIDPIDPFRITAGKQDLLSLARAIANLPEKTREIFMMNRVEDVDKHRLAERFGLTVRMIEIHIKRALTALDTDQMFGT